MLFPLRELRLLEERLQATLADSKTQRWPSLTVHATYERSMRLLARAGDRMLSLLWSDVILHERAPQLMDAARSGRLAHLVYLLKDACLRERACLKVPGAWCALAEYVADALERHGKKEEGRVLNEVSGRPQRAVGRVGAVRAQVRGVPKSSAG